MLALLRCAVVADWMGQQYGLYRVVDTGRLERSGQRRASGCIRRRLRLRARIAGLRFTPTSPLRRRWRMTAGTRMNQLRRPIGRTHRTANSGLQPRSTDLTRWPWRGVGRALKHPRRHPAGGVRKRGPTAAILHHGGSGRWHGTGEHHGGTAGDPRPSSPRRTGNDFSWCAG